MKTSKMTSAAVAVYGHRAFRAGKITAVPGFQNKIFVLLNRILPRKVPRKLVKFYNPDDGMSPDGARASARLNICWSAG